MIGAGVLGLPEAISYMGCGFLVSFQNYLSCSVDVAEELGVLLSALISQA